VLKGLSKGSSDELSVVDPNNPEDVRKAIPEEKEEPVEPEVQPEEEPQEEEEKQTEKRPRKSFIENWSEKFRNFLNDDL
jgi:hypothetical protein